MLKVKKERGILWIQFYGKVDRQTEDELEQILTEGLAGVKELWLDLAGVEDVSSVMVRILSYARIAIEGRGQLYMFHLSDRVRRRLGMPGGSWQTDGRCRHT